MPWSGVEIWSLPVKACQEIPICLYRTVEGRLADIRYQRASFLLRRGIAEIKDDISLLPSGEIDVDRKSRRRIAVQIDIARQNGSRIQSHRSLDAARLANELAAACRVAPTMASLAAKNATREE